MSDAIAKLRIIRDAYLKDFDDEIMKSFATGTPIPEDLATYMQELRDLPDNVNPQLDSEGNLDETSFEWPIPPLWWWNKRGFDARGDS